MFKVKAPDGTNNLCGKNLRKLRKNQGLTQRELASKLQLMGYDVDHYFILRAENGTRFVTDIELDMLSKALDVSVDKLLEK